MKYGRFLKTLLVLFFGIVVAASAAAQVQLAVEASKKTTKTNQSGTSSKSYVDRVTLTITATGNGEGDLWAYFVARDARTHALKYYGVSKQPLRVAGKQPVRVESDLAAYSKTNNPRSSVDSVHGNLPFGWVVWLRADGDEIAVKASSPEVLKWVREHPPQKWTQVSP